MAESIVAPEDFGPALKTACTCGHIVCICMMKQRHKPECQFRKAMQCPVAIECAHGYDVCPICDPCTCGKETAK